MVFECREVRKRKGCDRTTCSFCVRIVFYILVGSYIVKVCRLTDVDHVVNLSSIIGHVKFEAGLSIEEKNQLVAFGKMGYTGVQSKNGSCRLFTNRTYDSDMLYRVVKKARTIQYRDASDLGNFHKSKGGMFDLASDRCGRLETLH